MDTKMFDLNVIELCIHVWCYYKMVTTHKQTIAERHLACRNTYVSPNI